MDWMIFGIVVAAVVLVDLLVRLAVLPAALRMFESKPPLRAEPAEPHPDAEAVGIPTTNGLTLAASVYRHERSRARGLIVFCPELGGNHWTAMNYCEGLWDAGFDILAFDFRNQGESEHQPGYEPLHWATEYEVADVMAAIRYARQRPEWTRTQIGLFGVSRGGGAALAAAARANDVACVACDSAFSTEEMMLHFTGRWSILYLPARVFQLIPRWHVRLTLRLVVWVSQLKRKCRYVNFDRCLNRLRGTPVYLLVGQRDNYVAPTIVESMARRIGPSCRKVWIAPGAKHNKAREVNREEYDRRLREFFALLSGKTQPVEAPQPQEV